MPAQSGQKTYTYTGMGLFSPKLFAMYKPGRSNLCVYDQFFNAIAQEQIAASLLTAMDRRWHTTAPSTITGAPMIWGKILGGFFGFLFARFVGLILGLMIGHWFDRALGRAMQQGAEQPQQFVSTLFAVLGHLAKSKGRVTEQDINYVTR